MTNNMAIWDALGKTDPSQTKGFTRGGGFKGTAVKPVYTEQKMTEYFGPCGVGWGFTKPEFQTINGEQGEIAVYCWLTLWYVSDGEKSAPIPGVGGDFVAKRNRNGLQFDDEAFKKAFTDALGNAMKHIGMSADVHMGRFDDAKYVAEVKEDIEHEKSEKDRAGAAGDYVSWAKTIIDKCSTKDEILDWWSGQKEQRVNVGLTQAHVNELKEYMVTRSKAFEQQEAA